MGHTTLHCVGYNLLWCCRRQAATTTAITAQQFVNVMSGKRTQSFTCAMHWRDRQVQASPDWHAAPAPARSLLPGLAGCVGGELLPDPRDRKFYTDRYSGLEKSCELIVCAGTAAGHRPGWSPCSPSPSWCCSARVGPPGPSGGRPAGQTSAFPPGTR